MLPEPRRHLSPIFFDPQWPISQANQLAHHAVGQTAAKENYRKDLCHYFRLRKKLNAVIMQVIREYVFVLGIGQ